MMTTRVVAQPALLTSAGHGLSGEVEKPKMSVRMACSFRTPLLRTCLDNKIVRYGKDFSSFRLGCVAEETEFTEEEIEPIMLAEETKFTEETIEAIMLARDESRRLGHNHIGIEHILLGLIGEGTATDINIMGIELKDAREQVEKMSPRGSGCFAVGFPFTSLLYSLEYAGIHGPDLIGPEHLLPGLLRQRVARRVLMVVSIVDEGDEVSVVTERSTVGYGANLSNIVGDYNEHVEKGRASAMPVKVHEPSVDETILILKHFKKHYEIRHKLRYTNEALIAAAELSYQYISDRPLPDKAIDLIDEAGARVSARYAQFLEETRELESEYREIIKSKDEEEGWRSNYTKEPWGFWEPEFELRFEISMVREMNKAEHVVTEGDIEDVVSSWTGIPVKEVITDESVRLLKMEETLHKRVIGQDEAVRAFIHARARVRVGARNPNGPIASFFFCGPTGVGKSELAKALAANYFGSEEAIIRIDTDRFGSFKYMDSPTMYTKERDQLTESVRKRPCSVLIFDGSFIDDDDVFKAIIEILEHGRLVDGEGRIVDFRNTILISAIYVKSSATREMGHDLDEDCSYNRMKSRAVEQLELMVKPIAKRFDEVNVFMRLTKLEVKEIAGVKLKEAFDRLEAKGIRLGVTERFQDRVVEMVVEQGSDRMYGAWPMCRAIRHLEDVVAEKMVAREIKEGDSVTVDADSDGNAVILNACSVAL